MIQDIFSEDETSRICSLPLSPGGQLDKLVWAGTKNGIYSIRSAYHLDRSLLERHKWESFNSNTVTVFWRKVWQVRRPPVVYLFLWKACNNILATKENLYKQKIAGDDLCLICGLESETTGHIL